MIAVSPLRAADRDEWRALFAAYAEFYETPLDDDRARAVWDWLTDAAHSLRGIVARDAAGAAAGIAHFSPQWRPLTGGRLMYLHDLFVDPEHRGGGAADSLLASVAAAARADGCQKRAG